MRNKWFLFGVLYFAALCVSISQLKFVTLIPVLAEGMQLSMTQVTWLMSVFTLVGVVLATRQGAPRRNAKSFAR